LTAEQLALFDQLQRIEQRALKLERLKRRARKLRKLLNAAFQGAGLGRGPDGRLIGRFQQRRALPPLAAREITWSEFQQLPPWDG
jgi:hypothetical protein